MIKNNLTILLLILAVSAAAQTATLTLHITNVEVIENSMVRIAVYNSEETYFDNDQMFTSGEVEVNDSDLYYYFNELPFGTYAITIYHDEDNDGEMDRRWYGPPKEGYAFSNNYQSAFKPASFEDAAFEFNGDMELEIEMRY